jgi:hypothetical protein
MLKCIGNTNYEWRVEVENEAFNSNETNGIIRRYYADYQTILCRKSYSRILN